MADEWKMLPEDEEFEDSEESESEEELEDVVDDTLTETTVEAPVFRRDFESPSISLEANPVDNLERDIQDVPADSGVAGGGTEERINIGGGPEADYEVINAPMYSAADYAGLYEREIEERRADEQMPVMRGDMIRHETDITTGIREMPGFERRITRTKQWDVMQGYPGIESRREGQAERYIAPRREDTTPTGDLPFRRGRIDDKGRQI